VRAVFDLHDFSGNFVASLRHIRFVTLDIALVAVVICVLTAMDSIHSRNLSTGEVAGLIAVGVFIGLALILTYPQHTF
jgi:hypothetical protein